MNYFTRIVGALTLMLAGVAHAATINLDASPSDYNSLTFASPYQTIVIPEGAPIDGQPVPLGRRGGVLVKFRDGATQPIQVIAQLVDNSVLHFALHPVEGAPATNWSQPGRGGQAAVAPFSRPNDDWLIGAFKSLTSGLVPQGFSRVDHSGLIAEFGGLQAQPLAAYSTAGFKVLVVRLRSEQYFNLLPEDLYDTNVIAVEVDGDRVGPDYHPVAYVLIRTGGA